MSKLPPPRVAPAAKQAIDAPRRTTFMLKPDVLALVGRGSLESKYTGPNDTKDGPEHPLYDPRALEEPSDETSESLGTHGQIQPIVVRKNGERYEVVAGRGRTLGARLWNLVHPEDPIELECKLCRGKDATELLELVIAENEHRREVPIVSKAKMAQRLLDRGRDAAYVANLFRVTTVTLQGWLPSLDMSESLQDAQEKGELSKYEADKAAHLSHAEQDAALALARETGESLGAVVAATGSAPARRRGNSTEPSTRPTLAEIRAAIEDKDNVIPWDSVTPRNALKWCIGDLASLIANDA